MKRKHRRRSGWTFKDILIWLVIFIVGSLIVSFLLSPSSFNNLKNNIEDLIPEKQNIQEQIEYELYHPTNPAYTCWDIEYIAKNLETSKKEWKKRFCNLLCESNDLEFGYFECKDDKLYCYCEK